MVCRGCRAPWRDPARHSAPLCVRQATWLGPSGSEAHAEMSSLLTEAVKCWVPCAGPQPRGGGYGALQGCGRMLATQGRRPAASAADAATCREI